MRHFCAMIGATAGVDLGGPARATRPGRRLGAGRAEAAIRANFPVKSLQNTAVR